MAPDTALTPCRGHPLDTIGHKDRGHKDGGHKDEWVAIHIIG